jgi:hypothetical protein
MRFVKREKQPRRRVRGADLLLNVMRPLGLNEQVYCRLQQHRFDRRQVVAKLGLGLAVKLGEAFAATRRIRRA